MKHHLYQIYYGGFKHKLENSFWCDECHSIISRYNKLPPYTHRDKTQLQPGKQQRHFNDK